MRKKGARSFASQSAALTSAMPRSISARTFSIGNLCIRDEWFSECVPIVCPASWMRLTTAGNSRAMLPTRKYVALTHCAARMSSTALE